MGRQLAPRAVSAAPGLSSSVVRQALGYALDGAGPFQGAATVAERHRRRHRDAGDVRDPRERAVETVVDDHVRLAGAQGLVTNLGGLVTATVAVPANLMGLVILQSRMVAGVAHLRGYDLDDPRTHNAVLAVLLGSDGVDALVTKEKLPAPPMALATAPVHDPAIDQRVSREVASAMVARVTGKRVASTVARRVPVVGGLVGLGADGLHTWQVGKYAESELRRRGR
ncbi:MAG: hypothetical protein CMH83_23120 [Nocardioides sp.]|nr:hypothetical protein [Nocardioides sp.]